MFCGATFGSNIKTLRTELNLTRQAFADLCNISIYTLRSYQAGEIMPSTKSFLKICNACSVSPNRLLNGIFHIPTEVETIASIDTTVQNLLPNSKLLFENTFNLVKKCMEESKPSLCNVDLGSRIKILREDAEISAQEFSKRCGVAPGTIACIESNQVLPGLEVILTMCQILQVSPAFLLSNQLTYLPEEAKPYHALTPRQISCLAELAQLFLKDTKKAESR